MGIKLLYKKDLKRGELIEHNCALFENPTVWKFNTYMMSDLGGIQNYRILSKIGSGSFAAVSRAKHTPTGSLVAMKTIRKAKRMERFLQMEIKILKTLCHPNICQLHEVIESTDSVYLVMQLCPNRTLHEYIQTKGCLNEPTSRHFFRQIVSAVSFMHSEGYCHRDIKSHNVVLDSNMSVKLIDFGLAVEINSTCATDVQPAGAISNMAAEVARGGEYDLEKADVWSLGVVLYQMLTSRTVFSQSNLVNLSVETILLLKQLMEMDPTKRISCKDLMDHPWLNAPNLDIQSQGDCLDKENLDEQCIRKMCKRYRVSQQQMRDMVAEWKFDDITATYILTLEKMKCQNSKCNIL